MTRIKFWNAPVITDTEPMVETAFYKWLGVEKIGRFADALKAYLEGYGFDITKYVLPEDQLKNYKAVFEYFWWCQ